jgi:pSer/pThr/pTyr-binding forkhead associated (FHA) protein
MATIIIISGAKKGDYYSLGHRTSVIGRAESLLIQILDEHVSRKHLQIRFDVEKQRYYALDMKSRHGVFINGKRIGEEEVLLVDDDRILVGETMLLFTDKDFPDRESALSHFKKVGEQMRPTAIQ